MLQVLLYIFAPVIRSGAAIALEIAVAAGAGTGAAAALFSLPYPEINASDAMAVSMVFFMAVVILRLANCKLFGFCGKQMRSE